MSEAEYPARPVHARLRGVMRRLGEAALVLTIQADSADTDGDVRRAASLRARAARLDERARAIADEHDRLAAVADAAAAAFVRGLLAGIPMHRVAEVLNDRRHAVGADYLPQVCATLWPDIGLPGEAHEMPADQLTQLARAAYLDARASWARVKAELLAARAGDE